MVLPGLIHFTVDLLRSLALLARHLQADSGYASLMLFLLTWIANSVNTRIEAAAFAGMAEGGWFTIITFLFPALLVSMAGSQHFCNKVELSHKPFAGI